MYGIPGMMGHFYFNPRSLTGATQRLLSSIAKGLFQSTLPHGSDYSIYKQQKAENAFQSTLPHGSDAVNAEILRTSLDFNPRSLTGATAPIPGLRELPTFQSTLPHGSDKILVFLMTACHDFNPRSLTGATCKRLEAKDKIIFQSTLPHGSDSIKTNYFSIHLNQAFFAN